MAKFKIKTNSSAKKRFKKTGSGKMKMEKAAHKHRLMQKSKRQKNLARQGIIVSDSHNKQLKKLLPYAA